MTGTVSSFAPHKDDTVHAGSIADFNAAAASMRGRRQRCKAAVAIRLRFQYIYLQ